MMRGVSHWAVAVREPADGRASQPTPSRATAPRRTAPPSSGRRRRAARAIQIHRERFVSRSSSIASTGCRSCAAWSRWSSRSRSASRRSASRPTPSSTSRRARRSASAPGACTIFLSLVFAVGLFFVLPVTVANFWKDQLGSSVLFVLVEKADPDLDLPRLPVGDLARARPAPGVRVPRRRAQDDLLLRGRATSWRPSARSALLAAAHALRHQLPADRDDHRRLRVRADRAARRCTG